MSSLDKEETKTDAPLSANAPSSRGFPLPVQLFCACWFPFDFSPRESIRLLISKGLSLSVRLYSPDSPQQKHFPSNYPCH